MAEVILAGANLMSVVHELVTTIFLSARHQETQLRWRCSPPGEGAL